MRIVVSILLLLMFSGCATDGAYGVARSIYVGGKEVVIANADLLDESTLEKLKTLDDAAVRYDKGRELVKKHMDADDTNGSCTAGIVIS